MTPDFVIVAVNNSEDPKHIDKVKMKTGDIVTRQNVVKLLENGKKIITAPGAEVSVVTVKGNKYIRTDKNSIEKDNLGSLPEF